MQVNSSFRDCPSFSVCPVPNIRIQDDKLYIGDKAYRVMALDPSTGSQLSLPTNLKNQINDWVESILKVHEKAISVLMNSQSIDISDEEIKANGKGIDKLNTAESTFLQSICKAIIYMPPKTLETTQDVKQIVSPILSSNNPLETPEEQCKKPEKEIAALIQTNHDMQKKIKTYRDLLNQREDESEKSDLEDKIKKLTQKIQCNKGLIADLQNSMGTIDPV